MAKLESLFLQTLVANAPILNEVLRVVSCL
jgi:hypothetical protein